MSGVKPLPNFILIKPDAAVERVGKLIIMADNGLSRVSENAGVVVAIPDHVNPLPEKFEGHLITHSAKLPVPVSVGDRVVFRGFLSEMNPLGDGTCLIHYGDILAVVEQGVDVGPFSRGSNHEP